MNHSIYSIDRATHLKIVVIAFLTATAIAGLSLCFHNYSKAPQAEIAVVVTGKPVIISSSSHTIAR